MGKILKYETKNAEGPICHCRDFDYLFSAKPLDYSVDCKFDIYKCKECGHGVTNVSDNVSLHELYNQGSYNVNESVAQKILRPFLNRLEFGTVRLLNKWANGSNLFEIGVGKGHFLFAASKLGFDVSGIEPSERSFSFAKKLLGHSVVYKKTLDEYVATSHKKFDMIYAWHVLEHISDPDSAIRHIKAILKPRGIVMIAVPNFSSFQAQFGKENWYPLDPPRHLHHLTPSGLTRLFKNHGMDILDVSYSSFFQNWIGEHITLLNWLSPQKNVLFNIARMNSSFFKVFSKMEITIVAIWNVVLSLLLLPVTLLMTFVNQFFRKSGTVVVIAKNGNDKGSVA